MRIHVRDQADEFQRYSERYGALWTPTILVLDPEGEERHRIEGFLEADAFLAQLTLGLAHAAFQRKDWTEAARRFEEVANHPDPDAAAEASYWAGVARYKASGDAGELAKTARVFQDRFQGTPWATKASIWAPPPG